MKYDVLREHLGNDQRFHRPGEVRDADPSTVAHLVRASVLAAAKGAKAQEKPADKEMKAEEKPANKAAPKPQNKAAE